MFWSTARIINIVTVYLCCVFTHECLGNDEVMRISCDRSRLGWSFYIQVQLEHIQKQRAGNTRHTSLIIQDRIYAQAYAAEPDFTKCDMFLDQHLR